MRHTPAFHTHKKRQLHLNVAFSLIVDGTAEAVAVATAAAGVAAATVAKKGENYIYLALVPICCAYAAYNAVRDNIIKWRSGNLLI